MGVIEILNKPDLRVIITHINTKFDSSISNSLWDVRFYTDGRTDRQNNGQKDYIDVNANSEFIQFVGSAKPPSAGYTYIFY